MISAIDIETQGLDATKFVMGCMITEKHKKPMIYYKKEDLWQRVLQLGLQEYKRGKVLYIYHHNAQYDTAGYVDLEDKNLRFFCNKPFIWTYMKEGKNMIVFLDTMSIYKMSLKKLGKIINYPKMETPEELINGENLNREKIDKIEPYLIRDTEIPLKSIQHLKRKLKNEGVGVKYLYTINQIAINYVLHMLRQTPHVHDIFWNPIKNQVRRTLRANQIHSAYRGGRVEPFKYGQFKNVTHIDINSLYPYSLINMPFPRLSSERLQYKPLKNMTIHQLLRKIGLSRAYLINTRDNYGLLPIRRDKFNYYPTAGQHIIGTYTHAELQEALRIGYKIIDIEWSVVYETMENPFTEIFEKLYKLRTESKNEFDMYFYKSIMNNSLGKMAQTRSDQLITIDTVEKAPEYLKEGYEIVKGIKLNYMYEKIDVPKRIKNYYMPIVPTLVNAHARIYLHQHMRQIPLKDLIYTDTDSLMFQGDYLNKFPINEEIGSFKIEHKKSNMIVYGRKTYSIGDDIKIGGFKSTRIGINDFKLGKVKSTKQITVKTTDDMKEVGKFQEVERNLELQTETNKTEIEQLKKKKLLVDNDIENINYFIPSIKRYISVT